jgi:hypothetical protein
VTGFGEALLAGSEGPVRRFFTHAIREAAPLPSGVRLSMAGRIRAGRWLPFVAEQDCDARSFSWRARVGWRRVTPLHVHDRYERGAGSVELRLFGRLRLSRSADPDTTRSAAGRAALEAVVFAPATVVPGSGVHWRADGEDRLVARFDLPPERPEVHVQIDESGAMRTAHAQRWGDPGGRGFGYVPCGCEVHAERRLGDFVIPSRISVGWWFGTPGYEPFFEAEIRALRPVGASFDAEGGGECQHQCGARGRAGGGGDAAATGQRLGEELDRDERQHRPGRERE